LTQAFADDVGLLTQLYWKSLLVAKDFCLLMKGLLKRFAHLRLSTQGLAKNPSPANAEGRQLHKRGEDV